MSKNHEFCSDDLFATVSGGGGGGGGGGGWSTNTKTGASRKVNTGEVIACKVIEGAAGGIAGRTVSTAAKLANTGAAAAGVGGAIGVTGGWCEKLMSTSAGYDDMMNAP